MVLRRRIVIAGQVLASCFIGSAFQQILPRSRGQLEGHGILTPRERHRSSSVIFMARMNNNNNNKNGRGRVLTKEEDSPVMNQEIKSPELRVVAPVAGGKDESFGIMTRQEALDKAKEMGGLDLIMINDKADPPVCKIVDYSKYRYMQEKKAKEVRKNSKVSEIKEVKMSYKIDVHDYEVRKKNALRFLRQGNRVKCTVMFRGREVTHDNLGFDLLSKLTEDLTDTATTEGRAKREGRNLAVILSPRPEVMKAISDERRAEERARKKKKKEELELRAHSKTELSINTDQESDEDFDEEDEIDDDDEDVEDSLDALLGGSDILTKNLFD